MNTTETTAAAAVDFPLGKIVRIPRVGKPPVFANLLLDLDVSETGKILDKLNKWEISEETPTFFFVGYSGLSYSDLDEESKMILGMEARLAVIDACNFMAEHTDPTAFVPNPSGFAISRENAKALLACKRLNFIPVDN